MRDWNNRWNVYEYIKREWRYNGRIPDTQELSNEFGLKEIHDWKKIEFFEGIKEFTTAFKTGMREEAKERGIPLPEDLEKFDNEYN